MLKLLTVLFTVCLFQFASAEAPLRHVVIFKFKDDVKPEQITAIEQQFVDLKGKIESIEDLEWGTNTRPEAKEEGFTHCFFVTFKNQEDLDKYSPHPEHQKFVANFKPVLDKLLVIDYYAK
ncbi:Dabb family protein [Rubritalea sp.]|uniref:Dabb family protein n=1 Tax=Rubritalea sp. TaxID=2109375 RepID=UPI003EF0B5C4